MRVTYKLTMLAAALVLVAAACSDDDSSSETVAATTVATTSTTAAAPSTSTAATAPTTEDVLATPLPADITETYTIPDIGYSIDYPAGWFVRTNAPVTFIAQTEEELESRFADPRPPNVALGMGFDHRTVLFLQSVGLTVDDPTPQDLLEFNISNFDWTVLEDMGEVEIFGTTAAVVRVTDPDGDVAIEYQGIHPESGEIFLFGFSAPTEEQVDAFLPAWETIIESITAPEEASVALAAPLPADVTEAYTIPGFGYSIDYPAGWFVATDDSFTAIAQTEEELEARLVDPVPPAMALRIGLDHRTIEFLQGIGLTTDDPTAQDLLEFNISNFDWTDVRDRREVEIFGTTAAVVRITGPGGDVSIRYQGILPDSGKIFIFGFAGPTEESVDAFLPAWETMIESITATE